MRSLINSTLNIFLMCVSLLAFENTLAAGGIDGGGGKAIAFTDGTYHALDLVHRSELPVKPVAKEDIEKLWQVNRYVERPYSEGRNFFQPAASYLEKFAQEMEAVDVLLKNVIRPQSTFNYVKVVFSESPLNPNELLSKSVAENFQIPLAYYDTNLLKISKRVYDKLSVDGKIAFIIHESLRHLNYMNIIKTPLTTEEIEIAVRYFMGRSFPEDKGNLAKVLAKIKNYNPLNAAALLKQWSENQSTLQKCEMETMSACNSLDKISHPCGECKESLERLKLQRKSASEVERKLSKAYGKKWKDRFLGDAMRGVGHQLMNSEVDMCKKFDVLENKIVTLSECKVINTDVSSYQCETIETATGKILAYSKSDKPRLQDFNFKGKTYNITVSDHFGYKLDVNLTERNKAAKKEKAVINSLTPLNGPGYDNNGSGPGLKGEKNPLTVEATAILDDGSELKVICTRGRTHNGSN